MRTARRFGSTPLALGLLAALTCCDTGLPTVAYARDMLAAGDAFPVWKLEDQTGTLRSSQEVAGKRYLMWFYPKAMTSGCTAEGRGMRDAYADFRKLDILVFGISADEPAANAKFVAAEGFPFPLLSDPKLDFAKQVGADGFLGYARRVSYLIGPDGKVIKAYSNVEPAAHAKQVLDDLAAAP